MEFVKKSSVMYGEAIEGKEVTCNPYGFDEEPDPEDVAIAEKYIAEHGKCVYISAKQCPELFGDCKRDDVFWDTEGHKFCRIK